MKGRNQSFLVDAVDMLTIGSHSLENDDFSECFRPVSKLELYDSGLLYVFSLVIRYLFVLPLRLFLLLISSLVVALFIFIGAYFESKLIVSCAFSLFFRFFVFIFNCSLKHTGKKYRIVGPHIYVANHTSFLDYILMSSYKFSHACISESHGGMFGFIFLSFLSKNGSIAFRRSEKQDRERVLARIQEHIWKDKAPLVVFPEGTCVNNQFSVLFQRGVFSLGVPICPVSIHYNKELMDPYWNRRIQGFAGHFFYLLTRWYIEAEIHWGEPIWCGEQECPVNFSHRVKCLISERAGLRNTLWNGYFKSSPALRDRERLREAYRKVYGSIQDGSFPEYNKKDIQTKREYLLNSNIYIPDHKNVIYFGCMGRSAFITECCKEYLRMKTDSTLT